MPLDPQARAMLDQLEALGLPEFHTLEPEAARALSAIRPEVEVQPVAHVEDRTITGPDGEVPVRIYVPEGEGPKPGLVYFHGGGFVICDLESHDGICRALANTAGCVVVSVDYRLAPEHTWPAAPEDCFAATRWVAEEGAGLGIDAERLAVAGDSAGGNLAAVVSMMARDRGGPSLRHQLLVYPVTDHAFDTPSYLENAEGYLLTRAMMQWFWGHYLADPAHGDEAYASPLRAEKLSGLPPATVITAEFDPLRDEGEAYARRLGDEGIDVHLRRYDGVIHGFFTMLDALDASHVAVAEAGRRLRAAFAG